jgi:hypothetical protein
LFNSGVLAPDDNLEKESHSLREEEESSANLDVQRLESPERLLRIRLLKNILRKSEKNYRKNP